MHRLTVVDGAEPKRTVEITQEALVIGRDVSRPFHLADAEVSRAHCEIRLLGTRLMVRDLGSTNGTFVDGERVTLPREIPVGSLLTLGRHVLRHDVLTPEEAAQSAQLQAELSRARRYVEDLLPAPRTNGPIRLRWCFVPTAQLGGDCFGYQDLPDGRIALYVTDVCGHGVSSALHAAAVIHVLRNRTLADTDFGEPTQVLERLNASFAMEDHGGMYFSAWYGVFEPQRRRLRFASAGHPPALVVDARGHVSARLATENPAIGIMGPRRFTGAETVLEPGRRLLLLTDGAFEIVAGDGRVLGLTDFEARLAEVASRSGDCDPRALHEAARQSAGGDLEDDFTVVTLEATT
ncbi:MAG: SpoIIE family protein phosphatase [Planctomycetota bacterium]